MVVIVVVSAIVTITIPVVGCVRWIYRQWQSWRATQAKIDALEARMIEMQAALNSDRDAPPSV